jgi:hypothetical protein
MSDWAMFHNGIKGAPAADWAEAQEVKSKLGIGKTVDERIAKLKANNYQYASAGDSKALIDEIERLRKPA